jgi:hypothetical protein
VVAIKCRHLHLLLQQHGILSTLAGELATLSQSLSVLKEPTANISPSPLQAMLTIMTIMTIMTTMTNMVTMSAMTAMTITSAMTVMITMITMPAMITMADMTTLTIKTTMSVKMITKTILQGQNVKNINVLHRFYILAMQSKYQKAVAYVNHARSPNRRVHPPYLHHTVHQ